MLDLSYIHVKMAQLMSVRLVKCSQCDHMVRFGRFTCGSCGARTSLINWTLTHIILVGLVIVFGIIGFALL